MLLFNEVSKHVRASSVDQSNKRDRTYAIQGIEYIGRVERSKCKTWQIQVTYV